jgi:membrane-associated protein
MVAIETLSGTLLYLTAFFIVFSETGVFFLFFLPGDSLLFALGLLANDGAIKLGYILPLLIIAAIIGNILAYYLGNLARAGIQRGTWFRHIKQVHLDRARIFYERHGMFAILFARFIPVIRTFVPFFAGIVSMDRKKFMFWTALGGVAWITIVVGAGYFLGREFNIQNIAFLGTGMVVAAVVATPIFIALINRFLKHPR